MVRMAPGVLWMACMLATTACGDSAPPAENDVGSSGTGGTTGPGTVVPGTTDEDTGPASTSAADSTGSSTASGTDVDESGTTSTAEDTGDDTGTTGDPEPMVMPFDCVWAPPDSIAMEPPDGASYEGGTVEMDADGTASAVIWESNFPEYYIQRHRFDPDPGTWGPADILQTDTAFSSNRFLSGADAMGGSWHGWTSQATVYGLGFEPGTGWSMPQVVGGSGQSFQTLQDHALTMDAAGNIVQAWEEHDNTVYARRYNAGTGVWGAAHQLMAGPEGQSILADLSAASFGSGEAVVAWRRSGLDAGMYAATWDPATGWSDTESLGPAAEPHAVGNAAGDAVILARTTGLTPYHYDAATGDWVEGSLLYEPMVGQLGNPRVEMGADGSVMAIWRVLSGGGNDLWASHYDETQELWTEPELISEINAGWPLLAVNGGGHAIVAHEGGTGFATRCFDADLGTWGTTTLTEVSSLDNIWSLTGNDEGDAALLVHGNTLVDITFLDTVFAFTSP